MLSDFHLHTCFSGDSDTPVRDQIHQALCLGMKEICFTDHYDYDVISDVDFTFDIPAYFSYMRRMKEEFSGKIDIRIGIELGLQLHAKKEIAGLVQDQPFDFIIGSNHFIDGMDVYYPAYFEGHDEDERYRHYFEQSFLRLKAMDCYHVAGHLDYVVRYGPNRNLAYSLERYQDSIDPILKLLIEKGKGLECNTGGYHYGLGHPNPCESVLKRYRQLGGEILTLGSDAHTPDRMGYEFERARQVLLDCGFRYYTVFREQKPVFLPL